MASDITCAPVTKIFIDSFLFLLLNVIFQATHISTHKFDLRVIIERV